MYLFGIIVFSSSAGQYEKNLRTVLELLEATGEMLRLSKAKCIHTEVYNLGHVSKPDVVEIVPDMIETVQEAMCRQTVSGVRSLS